MTDKDVIKILKKQKTTPPGGAMERCIASLPDVKRRRSILPLIKLQFFSLPPRMYAGWLIVIVLQLRLMLIIEHPEDALFMSGIAGALVALFLAWHLTLAAAGGMADIERCCKYSYGQILLSRVLCLCILTTAALLSGAVPGAIHYALGMKFILLAILPTACGALAAILWANLLGNPDSALMAVYLVASLLASLGLRHMMGLAAMAAWALLLGVMACLLIQTKSLMNRRIEYEAYHY